MSTPPNVTVRPVGGMPMNSPVWVPVPVTRQAARSPSTTMSTARTDMSEKPAWNTPTSWAKPSTPFRSPSGVCSM
jgi:hypothetical protein